MVLTLLTHSSNSNTGVRAVRVPVFSVTDPDQRRLVINQRIKSDFLVANKILWDFCNIHLWISHSRQYDRLSVIACDICYNIGKQKCEVFLYCFLNFHQNVEISDQFPRRRSKRIRESGSWSSSQVENQNVLRNLPMWSINIWSFLSNVSSIAYEDMIWI